MLKTKRGARTKWLIQREGGQQKPNAIFTIGTSENLFSSPNAELRKTETLHLLEKCTEWDNDETS